MMIAEYSIAPYSIMELLLSSLLKAKNRFLINNDFHKFMIKSKEFKLSSYVLQYMSTNVKVKFFCKELFVNSFLKLDRQVLYAKNSFVKSVKKN